MKRQWTVSMSSRIPTSISLVPTPTCCRATWRPFSQAGMWEISMLPLSFREFVEATGLPAEQAFAEYGKSGSLPYVAVMERTDEKVEAYLEGIYNTVIVKDIEDRQSRKENDPKKRKVNDIVLLKTIARYLACVIGSPVSIQKCGRLSDFLRPEGVYQYRQRLYGGFSSSPMYSIPLSGLTLWANSC